MRRSSDVIESGWPSSVSTTFLECFWSSLRYSARDVPSSLDRTTDGRMFKDVAVQGKQCSRRLLADAAKRSTERLGSLEKSTSTATWRASDRDVSIPMRCPLIVIIAHLVFCTASVTTAAKRTPASTIGPRRGFSSQQAHTLETPQQMTQEIAEQPMCLTVWAGCTLFFKSACVSIASRFSGCHARGQRRVISMTDRGCRRSCEARFIQSCLRFVIVMRDISSPWIEAV
jgi:hypothetical protein